MIQNPLSRDNFPKMLARLDSIQNVNKLSSMYPTTQNAWIGRGYRSCSMRDHGKRRDFE